jgi:hypothetical protein
MTGLGQSVPESISSLAVSSSSTVVPSPGRPSSTFGLAQKQNRNKTNDDAEAHVERNVENFDFSTPFEKAFNEASNKTYKKMSPASPKPFSHQLGALFLKNGKLSPFPLLRQDMCLTGLCSISSYSQVLYMSSSPTFCPE